VAVADRLGIGTAETVRTCNWLRVVELGLVETQDGSRFTRVPQMAA
jgi:hypothetical protein